MLVRVGLVGGCASAALRSGRSLLITGVLFATLAAQIPMPRNIAMSGCLGTPARLDYLSLHPTAATNVRRSIPRVPITIRYGLRMDHRSTRLRKLRMDENTTEFMPSRPERAEGHSCRRRYRVAPSYCLSYTAVLVNFLPLESVPVMVTVRVLPSADTTARPLMVTLSPFLLVKVSVRSLTFL